MSTGSPQAVCIVSPHGFFIQEVGRVLASAQLEVVGHAVKYSLAPELECACPEERRVWVMDACLPPQSTESLAGDLRRARPDGAMVAVADELTDPLVFPLLRAGVRGFLTYDEVKGRLVQAVNTVAQGRTWIARAQLTAFVDLLLGRGQPSRLGPGRLPLSQREKDVLALLLRRLANKEIACRLDISERTVKFHVSNLLAKFGVERRADLILRALSDPQPE